ncbi:MAG: hypothetical protein WCG08_16900, partial [Paludibacter sp.]
MMDQKQTPSDSPKSSGVNIITQDKDTNFIDFGNSDFQSKRPQSEVIENKSVEQIAAPVFKPSKSNYKFSFYQG